MTKKQKTAVFLCSLLLALPAALAGAFPYGYFLLALDAAGSGVVALCWALYGFVAVLLWLAVWRAGVLVVRHWPGRRG